MKQETYEYIEDQLEEMEEDADSIKAGVNCIRKALKDSKDCKAQQQEVKDENNN